jgi:hypothetical protein
MYLVRRYFCNVLLLSVVLCGVAAAERVAHISVESLGSGLCADYFCGPALFCVYKQEDEIYFFTVADAQHLFARINERLDGLQKTLERRQLDDFLAHFSNKLKTAEESEIIRNLFDAHGILAKKLRSFEPRWAIVSINSDAAVQPVTEDFLLSVQDFSHISSSGDVLALQGNERSLHADLLDARVKGHYPFAFLYLAESGITRCPPVVAEGELEQKYELLVTSNDEPDLSTPIVAAETLVSAENSMPGEVKTLPVLVPVAAASSAGGWITSAITGVGAAGLAVLAYLRRSQIGMFFGGVNHSQQPAINNHQQGDHGPDIVPLAQPQEGVTGVRQAYRPPLAPNPYLGDALGQNSEPMLVARDALRAAVSVRALPEVIELLKLVFLDPGVAPSEALVVGEAKFIPRVNSQVLENFFSSLTLKYPGLTMQSTAIELMQGTQKFYVDFECIFNFLLSLCTPLDRVTGEGRMSLSGDATLCLQNGFPSATGSDSSGDLSLARLGGDDSGLVQTVHNASAPNFRVSDFLSMLNHSRGTSLVRSDYLLGYGSLWLGFYQALLRGVVQDGHALSPGERASSDVLSDGQPGSGVSDQSAEQDDPLNTGFVADDDDGPVVGGAGADTPPRTLPTTPQRRAQARRVPRSEERLRPRGTVLEETVSVSEQRYYEIFGEDFRGLPNGCHISAGALRPAAGQDYVVCIKPEELICSAVFLEDTSTDLAKYWTYEQVLGITNLTPKEKHAIRKYCEIQFKAVRASFAPCVDHAFLQDIFIKRKIDSICLLEDQELHDGLIEMFEISRSTGKFTSAFRTQLSSYPEKEDFLLLPPTEVSKKLQCGLINSRAYPFRYVVKKKR